MQFLGGLSLHLNHLIASCTAISFRQFGTLPIDIFLSSTRTPFGQFWHMSIFGDSRAVWVLLSNYRAFRKSIFSRWRSIGVSKCSGDFRWAGPRAIWWYHFWGGATHLGGLAGCWVQRVYFLTHLRQLRGYSALTDFIKNRCQRVL